MSTGPLTSVSERLQLAAALVSDALATSDETCALLLLQRARAVIATAETNVLMELAHRLDLSTTSPRELTRA